MKAMDSTIGSLSSIECWDFLKNNTNSYLIDVRSKEEWDETGIADLCSINNEVKTIPWKFFTPFVHQNMNFLEELYSAVPDKQSKLFFICKTGGRSLQAAMAANQYGYIDVYNVNDGFEGNVFNDNMLPMNVNGWMNCNLPRKNYVLS